jgi:hypothetical protein
MPCKFSCLSVPKQIKKSKNLQLPQWIQLLYEDDVFFEIRDEFFVNVMPTFELQQLRTGAMVKRFLTEMDQVIDSALQFPLSNVNESNQTEFPKITIISGHDSTLGDWLIDLDWESPSYGAAIFMELYQVTRRPNNMTSFIIKVELSIDIKKIIIITKLFQNLGVLQE